MLSVEGYNIIHRKKVNIGMATALPNGNLIVPVIKDADQKSLLGIIKNVNDLATGQEKTIFCQMKSRAAPLPLPTLALSTA